MLIPLDLPPGIVRNGTEYQSAGRWRDGHLVRFGPQGIPQPVGGWQVLVGFGAFVGQDAAGVWSIADSQEDQDGVIGQANNIYSVDPDLTNLTATPIRIVGGIAQLGSNALRTLLAWRANDGIAHLLVGANDAVYHFTSGVSAIVTPAGLVGGAEDSAYAIGGFGSGRYGAGLYGVGDATQSSLTEAAVWTFDTFGEDAVGVLPSDGKLWYYDTSAGGLMTQPAGSPTGLVGVVVTPERFVVVLGGTDPRTVQWASQETTTDWTPTALNTAGSFPLPTQGLLMCARAAVSETLIWTTEELFSMQYVGTALVYRFAQRGTQCGIIGRQAVAMLDGRAVWMSSNGFFLYDGTVRSLPCDVHDAVFGDLNQVQKSKCWAVAMSDFAEVWFCYPSAGSQVPDRVAIWNYRDNHWALATLVRFGGAGRSAFEYPVLCDRDTVYLHEIGTSRAGVEAPWLESGPVEIANGERVMDIVSIIPDEARAQSGPTLGALTGQLFARLYPTAAESSVSFSFANPTDVRVAGRQVRLRVDESTAGDWRLGTVRLDVRLGGRR